MSVCFCVSVFVCLCVCVFVCLCVSVFDLLFHVVLLGLTECRRVG